MGDYVNAIADYSQAIRLDGRNNFRYYERGQVYFATGSMAEAISDFNQALKLSPTCAFCVLWLEIAEWHNKAPSHLVQNSKQLATDGYPLTVSLVRLLRGEIKRDAVFSASKLSEYQQCQASFFVGEAALLKGEREDARNFFQRTVDHCKRESIESIAANWELRELNKAP